MLKNINLKKEYLLIAGAMALLIASYQLAFRKTVEQWHLHSKLQSELNPSGNMGYQPGYYARKNENLNKIISHYKIDTSIFRVESVNSIAMIAQYNGTRLIDVPTTSIQTDTGNIIIERVKLEGDYFSLLKTGSVLSRTDGIGVLRAMSVWRVKAAGQAEQEKKLQMEVDMEVLK
jgi:hypothetical protein